MVHLLLSISIQSLHTVKTGTASGDIFSMSLSNLDILNKNRSNGSELETFGSHQGTNL